ncbi:uncharacterized protein KY384_003957 [Bacidia gigantensis]|uniref:uncharacterized protein n=1 Tax=Bacidia gigantensis TaxID=2732470 RepID=UPI001D03AB03|nr:uncharacterized protein KY384_003957 [Bacidia gigantensis]KAG8532316.1 hypothetical protein KY384_003957 [Bacidia gigantensis]
MHGEISDPRFSVVWIEVGGQQWRHLIYDTKTNVQSFIQNGAATGYVLTLLAAIGDPTDDSTKWSAYMQLQTTNGTGQDPGQWFWKFDLTTGGASDENSFAYYNQLAHQNRQILTCFTTYGIGAGLVIAAAWAPQAQNTFDRWHAYGKNASGDFQTLFNSETSLPGFQPYYLGVSADHQYTSAFSDRLLDVSTVIYGKTEQEFLAEQSSQITKNANAIHIQAGGSGNDVLYSAIFAGHAIEFQKGLFQDRSAPSIEPPSPNIVSSYEGTGVELQDFLRSNDIDSGQIAVFKNGIVKVQHGEDWQTASERLTALTDLFPIAGLSEIFLSAAVSKLFSTNVLSPNDTAYTLLPTVKSQDPKDRRANDITIQQLLDHTSGYAPDLDPNGYDPVFHMRDIALSLGLTSTATKRDIVEYIYTQRPLEADPGSDYHDANYNYLLLSFVIEAVTKTDYLTWLTANIIQPAGIGVTGFPTIVDRTSSASANFIIPKDQGLGPSAVYPNQPASQLVPYTNGGDGMVREVAVGCLGLASSASYLAYFIHSNAVQGIGERAINKSRVSSVAGGLAYAESRSDGHDWAFVVNSRDWSGFEGDQPWKGLVERVNGLLDMLT